jgi:hypothetical protein
MFGTILGFATKIITEIPKIINIVEKVKDLFKGDMTGEEKHALAVGLSKDAILEMEEFAGKEIADEERFSRGLDQIISGANDIMSAVRKKSD